MDDKTLLMSVELYPATSGLNINQCFSLTHTYQTDRGKKGRVLILLAMDSNPNPVSKHPLMFDKQTQIRLQSLYLDLSTLAFWSFQNLDLDLNFVAYDLVLKALDCTSGDLGSIPQFATDPLRDFGQIFSVPQLPFYKMIYASFLPLFVCLAV